MIAEDTVTIMEEAPNTTEKINSLGNLSLLPREIRDEIYRYALPKKKYSFGFICHCASLYDSNDPICYGSPRYRRLHSKCREWTESNLSILCLSKAINEEAMASLYLNGIFVFRNDDEELLQHPSTDNMTKIEIYCSPFFDLDWDKDRDSEHNKSIACHRMSAGPLVFFRGDTIKRKSILIVLELGGFWHRATNMTTSPLFKALRQLTGFETVTLRLATVDDDWGRKPDDKDLERMDIGFGPILEDMSIVFEPTLGKSSAKSKMAPEEITPSFQYLRSHDIVFHLRNHQAAISKAKKDE